MRVLQLCHKPPFPVKDGGCLAINQISESVMHQGHALTIVSIATPKHPFDPSEFPVGYLSRTNFKAIFVDTSINMVDAFSNLVTADTYHVSRFFSSDVDKALDELLQKEEFDVVICESIYVAPYIPILRRLSNAKIILRSHNLEFSIWHRLAKSHRSGIKKTYLKILTRQLKDYEVSLLGEIDGLIAINADEMKHYRRLGFTRKGITVPFGIKPESYTPSDDFDPDSVFHLGSMDWKPNEEGIEWFLEKVWPEVVQKNPNLVLYLAGRRMPDWLLGLRLRNVKVIGEVASARDFINSKNIMIVPLKSGGGMRVKIIEALALRKPVVSTPLGANGVAVKNGEHAMIARKPSEFAEAILSLAANRNMASEIAANGRALVLEHYDTGKLSGKLNDFLTKVAQ